MDIKYAYYESSVGYKITGKTGADVLVSGGSKPLSEFYHSGNFTPGDYVPTGRSISINGISYDLTADRSWTIPDTDTITRLRGTTSGTFISGDITLAAGANTTITQSLDTITIETDLSNYIPVAEKGEANGVVPLNAQTQIDAAYLPSYVDDIIEAASLTALNALPSGEKVTGKIYVTLDNNKTYRWGGSAFVEVSSGAIGLASSTTPGIVKLYTNTEQAVEVSNVHSVVGRTYGVQKNGNGQLVVNVPWVDANTNTTYSGSDSIKLSGTSFQREALTGDVIADLNSNTTTIENNVVTNEKLKEVPTQTIKGRKSAGDGVVEDLTPTEVRTILGITAAHTPTNITNTATVTHNFNTRRINVSLMDTVTFYEVFGRIRKTTVNTVVIEFDSIPPNPIEVTITKLA